MGVRSVATIKGSLDERVFRILQWKGVNESPDGDVKLETGEAALMRNFRVTRDGNLQKRPGSDLLTGVCRSYRLDHGEPETARSDVKYCSQLKLYPAAEAGADGYVHPSGTEVYVDIETAADHVGWYWFHSKHEVWRLVSCEETDTGFDWTMERVRCVPSDTTETTVRMLWSGRVDGRETLLAACDGRLWELHDGTDRVKTELAALDTSGTVSAFGFGGKVWILNGKKYYCYDGTAVTEPEGYRPLVSVSIPAAGGGTLLEQVNKLTPARRVWLSPDGTATTFPLPEKDLESVDWVKVRADGSEPEYTADLSLGTVTFTAAPATGVNSVEIGYSVKTDFRDQVEAMTFAEIFNGANDNRVFLYGDGTNRAIYSGLDYDGNPRADYFPDMNVLTVGAENTPVTALCRHYTRLLCFKTDSCYSVQYSVTMLADGTTTPTYYSVPVHRDIGNAAPGQVRLVENWPRSLHGSACWEWKTDAYTVAAGADERKVRRISDRVGQSLRDYDLASCVCFDDDYRQEYYICEENRMLVHNYGPADAWYAYDGITATAMAVFRGELLYGDPEGRVNRFDYGFRTDNGETISCRWESGSMPFDREWARKYSAMLWVGIKPEGKNAVWVTLMSDRKSLYTEKIVSSGLMTFASADFRKWSFNTNRLPHQRRRKIKAKKFVFYKLVFHTEDPLTTVTILDADIRVRYTGYAR